MLICLKGRMADRERDRKREKKISSIHGLTLQMLASVGTGPG